MLRKSLRNSVIIYCKGNILLAVENCPGSRVAGMRLHVKVEKVSGASQSTAFRRILFKVIRSCLQMLLSNNLAHPKPDPYFQVFTSVTLLSPSAHIT